MHVVYAILFCECGRLNIFIKSFVEIYWHNRDLIIKLMCIQNISKFKKKFEKNKFEGRYVVKRIFCFDMSLMISAVLVNFAK